MSEQMRDANLTPPEGFTLSSPAFAQCPFPAYERIFAEQPVWRDPDSGFLVFTRYEDVRAIATNPAVWSNRTAQIFGRQSTVADQVHAMYEKDGWFEMDTLVTNDAPEHKRYRALVDKAFTPKRVATIVPIIDRTVSRLLDELLDKRDVEFMRTFAIPLTMTMLASQIGGSVEDMGRLRHWSDLLNEKINPMLAPERELAITPQIIEFQQYVARAIDQLRARPNDTILSDIVHAEIEGQHLTVREIIAIATQLLGAGHDTTTAALGSCMRFLAEHPGSVEFLKGHPDKVANFVEEMLRLEAPVQRLFRRATCATAVAGVPVREGEVVVIQWGGANRDPSKFPSPAEMRVDRPEVGRHLAFGVGAHFCIGNQLARAELRSAMLGITTRCKSIRLSAGDESFKYNSQYIFRALASLQVVAERA